MKQPRRDLTLEELEDAKRLSAAIEAYQRKHPEATQEAIADAAGWKTQSTISQYTRGKIALNMGALSKFCRVLGVSPYSISPRLASEMPQISHDKNVMEHPNGYTITDASIDSGHSGDYRLPLIPDSLPMLDRNEVLHWQESILQHQQTSIQGMISNIPINPSMFKYRVLGDDMAPQFIDGDILAIDPTRTAENAQYVLAEINGDPAVRQLMRIAGEWWLTLKNSAYADMKKPLAEAKIIGVVVAKLPPPTLYI
ncbi:XRE family transcriptional regulator [Methylomonas koyamae]|uniref:XRE family transcriptional regulator n=1 Tax=Methylomonas koyamae TaxID=702114 RepID=UPI0011295E86|nr:XRE family transcriptional regulator [Methylomonas koyamae]TPQ24919.1 hypothetical protein C2U68_17225 [Methylomonas koyamae]